MTRPNSVLFFGFGKMGQALAAGLLRGGQPPTSLHILTRASNRAAIAAMGLAPVEEPPAHADLIISAVKPGVFHGVWAERFGGRPLENRPLLLSAMARVSLSELTATGAAPARVMTTLACAFGQGVGVWDTSEERPWLASVLAAWGAHRRAASERDFADATVLSSLYGLTPELVYALETALNHNGASRSMQELVVPVLLAALADLERRRAHEPGLHPLSITDAVSSPGGTTAAMRQTLYEAGFYATLARAVEAASARAR